LNQPKKIETLVFDVSGVLIDDIYTVWMADSDAFEACGLGRIASIERFKEAFKLPIPEWCRSMGVPEGMMTKIEEEYRSAYPKYSEHIKIFPEVKSVLGKFKEDNYTLAIVSNILSSFLREHLQRFGIRKYFDVVTGQNDCKEQKPSPKPLWSTLEKLGSSPERSAYIGDMEEDIIAGKRAGVYTVGICRDESYHPLWKLKRQNPDFIIKDLNELYRTINAFNGTTIPQ
jgi:HAD superfamily hydrolase (TIGR01549 family)